MTVLFSESIIKRDKMKKHLIIGGSGGIGSEIIRLLPEEDTIVNFSRSEINTHDKSLEDYRIDVLNDELPDLEDINSIIYCPGSINLKPINSLKEEDFLEDFKINVLGAVRVIKKYHRDLKRNGGSIVMFSTVAVKTGMPFHSSVAAAKAGVEGLAKSLAAELAPKVRVNCIAPTVTNTNLAEKLLRNDKAKESTAERHPLKRYLDAEEVAELAVYLVSDKARGLTGEIIGLDAGIGSLRV
jgi:NAD(P)-dependent dehydrogenase (short-subunit alcohol dehydrogenase family)